MDQKKTQSSASGRSVEELQKLLLQKEGVLLAKGRLIDNMAYQIRTLSNAIIGFSDLLLMEEHLASELMEYVKEINQAGNGLSAIVNEVLDWTRLESGRKQITRINCDINELVSELEHLVSSALNSRGLTFSVSVDDDVPARIVIDANYLQKCLMNLTANAIRNSSTDLACRNYNLHVSAEHGDGRLFLRFNITGGNRLTSEQISHLFEPAAQEEDANNEIFSMLNMGLMVSAGLPLTRQLAETIGGKIEVTSSETNSTFSLLLDVSAEIKADLAASTNPRQLSKVSNNKTGDSLVLIVEDQPSNRTVISLMIESMGVKTESANDGFAGVEAASKNDYSLILMDLKMPGMDGYKAASEIRKMNIRTPIIALSAKVLNETENKQINSLFDGFLCKPIDSKNLARTLRQYVPELRLSQTHDLAAAPDDEIVFQYGH